MAELANVVSGNTITSVWGNQIRDRTIQRYASVAARTAGHGTPVEGDLSYLADSDTVWVYSGSAWVNGIGAGTVTGAMGAGAFLSSFFVTAADTVGSSALATSSTAELTCALVIPAGWSSWECVSMASGVLTASTASVNYNLRIDGTDLPNVNQISTSAHTVSIVGRRTGMTTTGSRNVNLMMSGAVTSTINSGYLVAMAFRTS